MPLGYPRGPFPPGRFVALPGRGTTYVRSLGDARRPPLLLLHGWAVTGALNWATAMPALARDFHVLAVDLRGHGRGNRSPGGRYTLDQDPADVHALIGVLGLDRPVVAGYSSGVAVATRLAHDHPADAGALVLCASGPTYPSPRSLSTALRAADRVLARVPPERLRGGALPPALAARPHLAAVDDLLHSDPRAIASLGSQLDDWDSSAWLPQVRTPAVVLATTHDADAPLADQRRLASLLRAGLRTLEGDHYVVATHPERWVPAITAACRAALARRPLEGPTLQ